MSKLRMRSLIAAALGVALIGGEVVQAQGKRKGNRENNENAQEQRNNRPGRERERTQPPRKERAQPPVKERTQPPAKERTQPPTKAQPKRDNNIPIPGKAKRRPGNPGQPGNADQRRGNQRGNQRGDRNRGRDLRDRRDQDNRRGRPDLRDRGDRRDLRDRDRRDGRRDIDNRIGRRWNGRINGDRRDFFRRRSNDLGSQLRIGIGSNGVRVGVGSNRIPNRRFNDWRNWNRDHYGRHRWYRGSWDGDWYGRWDNNWRRSWRRFPAAVALGATPWGFNRMGYWFGVNRYSNPYYSRPVRVGSYTIDYSQPLVAAPPEYDDDNATLSEFEEARVKFKERKYQAALGLVNEAIRQQPHDATLHEFRALCLYAEGDYREAAETLNPVLAVGPGWDWSTMNGLYSSVAEYTRHLRALEGYANNHPQDAYPHFLLGYHYLTMGHADAARKKFEKTVALAPKDQVAQQILNMLNENPKIEEPSYVKTDAKTQIDAEALVGTWNATRAKGNFRLQLNDDKSFVWTHRENGQTTTIEGVYAIQGGTLALEPKSGGVMMASVELMQNNRMKFRMIGSGQNDAVLTFSK